MANHTVVLSIFVSLVFTSLITLACDAIESGDESSKLYIVYMGSLPKGASYSPTSHHVSLLQHVMDESDIENRLVRSYKRSFNGFAVILNDQEREKLIRMRGVISVFQNQDFHLQTTRSWDFVGLPLSFKRYQTIESDLVVGVMDTGIWPGSKSFNDKGLGPIPKKWRGVCAGGSDFNCNKKIIGARFYGNGDVSARDESGHGTHTTSIVGGREVKGVSFYGYAKGIARGGVPSSRIAAYKVCTKSGLCSPVGILAAFDDAIADGVDVITISICAPRFYDFLNDPIAIGSFHAMEKGILTVQAAGNSGPTRSSVCSVSPWLFSVAGTTIDRQFIAKLILGNGKTYIEKCNSKDKKRVKGKLVLCGSPLGQKLTSVSSAIGSILNVSYLGFETAFVTKKPTLTLESKNFLRVQHYTNSTKYPIAEILKSEIFHDIKAPKVVTFSSRGPNPFVPEIMKPDISAPGVEILAAYSPLTSPSSDIGDKRKFKYNILSGTSMACPHAAGVVAYVKSFHPDWSPASIKSAIMTTATTMKSTYDDMAGEFAYGSGNINPQQAVHPGLVYDITKQDYVKMLCNYGYGSDKIKQISGDNSSCHEDPERSLVKDINYPAMVIPAHKHFNVKVHRTVTNVGFPNSTYKATLSHHDPKIKISVEPKFLSFKSLNEKQSFVIIVVGRVKSNQTVFSSSLVWSDGIHNVRSPIIVQILSL
ncbi:subtilisin-like protease SBT4.4 isoform X2 [Medicago truncatula]|uniref:subtilisin-like protease SBT4.4 isoform X2 n=1 Tax=Medicago truncatula TaxID=3880 RepID=UPI001967AAD0|nr:subtilisin-like protease SBT4.4 isoform X2 [Medicago truncatula]